MNGSTGCLDENSLLNETGNYFRKTGESWGKDREFKHETIWIAPPRRLLAGALAKMATEGANPRPQ